MDKSRGISATSLVEVWLPRRGMVQKLYEYGRRYVASEFTTLTLHREMCQQLSH